MPSSMCFAYLVSGAAVVCIFPPSLKSLWLNVFSEQVTEVSFFQEQRPFPQTIHLVGNPATPWTWANDVVKYFAVLRRAVSRVPFCSNDSVPGNPHLGTLLGKDATTVPGSCFLHPVHPGCPSFGGWYFNHISPSSHFRYRWCRNQLSGITTFR